MVFTQKVKRKNYNVHTNFISGTLGRTRIHYFPTDEAVLSLSTCGLLQASIDTIVLYTCPLGLPLMIMQFFV